MTQALTLLGTSEGLHLALSLILHARNRFIVNLLPLLQQGNGLRRVITVAAGGKEGPIDANDFEGWNVPFLKTRGHVTSLITLSLEAIASKAPQVSFIHDFPGPVRSGLGRDAKGVIMFLMKMVFAIIGPFIYIPTEESGERHLFVATSARYPPGIEGDEGSGVPLDGGIGVARGTDGKEGSGVYSVGWDGESAGLKVESLLDAYRKEGMVAKVWKYIEDDYVRITGAKSI